MERSRLAQAAIAIVLTLASVALLGWVLAYWTWIWFAPRPEPRAETPEVPAGSFKVASSLFGNARREQAVAAPTGLAIKLLGVVAAKSGGRSYAVVQLENEKILAVHTGEEVAPGIRLAEVHPDRVILERGGARETVVWPEPRQTASPVARKSKK